MRLTLEIIAAHYIRKKKVELFDIKISYRARLNAYSKKYFDPFRRGKRFDYEYEYEEKKTHSLSTAFFPFTKCYFTIFNINIKSILQIVLPYLLQGLVLHCVNRPSVYH